MLLFITEKHGLTCQLTALHLLLLLIVRVPLHQKSFSSKWHFQFGSSALLFWASGNKNITQRNTFFKQVNVCTSELLLTLNFVIYICIAAMLRCTTCPKYDHFQLIRPFSWGWQASKYNCYSRVVSEVIRHEEKFVDKYLIGC